AVNQNIVTSLVKKAVGISKEDEEFIIDIDKLQKVVTEKITVKDANSKLEELSGILLSGGRGSGKKNMPIALMKLSDIKAVAAAA
ncbi:MAG: hypothetical protein VB017_07120, partial [Endomicrobiaceae bacterium]|nr:hypothetical protein [Endomicrobiaceae bacterium]